MAYSKNQIIVDSRSIGFPGAIPLTGALLPGNYGTLLASTGIAFDTSLVVGSGDLDNRQNGATANFNFAQAGIYRVRCSADNAQEPATAFDIIGVQNFRKKKSDAISGNGSAVAANKRCAPLTSNNGKVTYFKVASAGTYLVSVVIKNTPDGVKTLTWLDNPMGIGFVIEFVEDLATDPEEPEPDPIGTGPVPGGCPPGPWVPAVPTCASPPSTSSTSGGLQITTNGENKVTLNLGNYAGQLVTLKVTNFLGTAQWVNQFGFNIPEASDIIAQPGGALGGSIYNRSAFSGQMGGTKNYYICNLDGGNNDFVFEHSSVPGPQPKRDLFTEVCVSHEDGSQSCSCKKTGVEYYNPWPKCGPELTIKKNGGSSVSWCYEDGGGAPYCDQDVTVEVLDSRAVLPSGMVCLGDELQTHIWVEDVGNASADGKCFSDFKNHSEPERFRDPATRTSISIPNMLCFNDFVGYAGAKTPGELGI